MKKDQHSLNIFKPIVDLGTALKDTYKKMTLPVIEEDDFGQIFPHANSEIILDSFNTVLKPTSINATNKRLASFLAQCGHETMGFTRFEENLNYSSTALLSVFGKYFSSTTAKHNQYKPEVIANTVYANRMGNGDYKSGDGYKYRGRGLIQLTGYNNYKAFAEYKDMSVEEVIKYLETMDGCLDSAIWYWLENSLNNYIDDNDFKGQTKRINGGHNGLKHRKQLYQQLIEIINNYRN